MYADAPCKWLTQRNSHREKSLSCLLKVGKFLKLYSHRNCFKISSPLWGPPPPPLPPNCLFFFSFQVCIMFLWVAPTIYLSLFFPSFFSFIILSPSLFFSLCVWLLGLICSLLPPTARSLLQPRCFYTNFSVQLSY